MDNTGNIQNTDNIISIPAVAMRGLTILPGMVIHFDLIRQTSINAVQLAMTEDQRLFAVTQRDESLEDPEIRDLYEIGTLVVIRHITKHKNGVVRVLAEGVERAVLVSIDDNVSDYILAEVRPCAECCQDDELHCEAIRREVMQRVGEYAKHFPLIGKSLGENTGSEKSPGRLLDSITANIPLHYTKKQAVLSATDVMERFELLCSILEEETRVAGIRDEISKSVKARVDKNQRDYILREQLSYIREELGDDSVSDADRFTEELDKLKAQKTIKEKIKKEISRFRSIASSSSEAAVQRGYIETLLELPWEKTTRDNNDILHAQQILERDHYGLEDVKERILEYLAVRSLTGSGDGPILCLAGPPGTGKTSIARSVADALGRKYVRICLGGVRDEAEIRGHRRTYVGAMPGRIATALRQSGVRNPLILLDEIDKVGTDQKGDTASALLEVLDSEQNSHFQDHYVELPLDLSKVLFLATANQTSAIPRPLLDRMEIIEVTSYTDNEKFHIAKEHLVKKAFEKNGITEDMLGISDTALRKIICFYTREAGVRELERKLEKICRRTARMILEGKKKKVRITAQNLENYLGKKKYLRDSRLMQDEAGVVCGLAWTSVGGEILKTEVSVMPGSGEIELTGQMGEVMKESAVTGISFIRSIAKTSDIKAEVFKKNDFHIHIPEGAVPKDGPSAGITMATAVYSAIRNIPVRSDVAMTGEITLRGRVLPIGGLKEKLLAAKTAGIRKVLVPYDNLKDVEEISAEIKSGLEIVTVKTMDEVLAQALTEPPKGRPHREKT